MVTIEINEGSPDDFQVMFGMDTTDLDKDSHGDISLSFIDYETGEPIKVTLHRAILATLVALHSGEIEGPISFEDPDMYKNPFE